MNICINSNFEGFCTLAKYDEDDNCTTEKEHTTLCIEEDGYCTAYEDEDPSDSCESFEARYGYEDEEDE